MFTIAILYRSLREQANNWKHLGFIPSQDFVSNQQGAQQETITSGETAAVPQLYVSDTEGPEDYL
jgi:hypothetical protein